MSTINTGFPTYMLTPVITYYNIFILIKPMYDNGTEI
jgi:hypothetical protein